MWRNFSSIRPASTSRRMAPSRPPATTIPPARSLTRCTPACSRPRRISVRAIRTRPPRARSRSRRDPVAASSSCSSKVEMVAVTVGGKLLVNDLPAKGDVENSTSTPIVFDAKPSATPTAPPKPTAPPGTGSRVLNVPWYHQAYVLSCESAALRMALAYQRIATTDRAVLDIIGHDLRGPVFDSSGMHWGNPFATFVGNVNGSEVALTGYGTYYPTIAHAATVLGGRVLRSGQNISPADLYDAILSGHPAVVWVTYHWVKLTRKDYVAFDGKTVPYAGPGEHAVTVVGV
ncbi:MAG: hypothetical protein E6J25_02025, partial [Chloroflexi bacterium]